MPIPITWNYRADQGPPPQVPATLLSPNADPASPVNSLAVGTGSSAAALNFPDLLNQNFTQLDLLGRLGGGARAVVNGLDFRQPTGLTLPIGAGQALLDGPATLIGATLPDFSEFYNLVLANNMARIYIWAVLTAPLTCTPRGVNNDPTPPAGACCYLGSATTLSGAVTELDYSNRQMLLGPFFWRRTADTGAPLDTPPAALAVFTRTKSGVYLWDSVSHQQLGPGMSAANLTTGNGTASTTAAQLVAARATRVRVVVINEDPGIALRVGANGTTVDATHGLRVPPGASQPLYFTGRIDVASESGTPAWSVADEYN